MDDKINDVSNLIIYKQYVELIYYTNKITEKFPKFEKVSLVKEIKDNTYDGMKCILCAYKYYDLSDKLKYLNRLDVDLKMIKILIRVSKNNKYITPKNYYAWSKKLENIGILLGGWINKCVKH